MQYLLIIFLVILSGLFSGLTIGLFTLNVTALERKARLGDNRAQKVLPERRRANQLLCTLLLGNVAVNSVIAILIESIAGGVMAGILATSFIFIFGEILPQAFFSRFALSFGARIIWLVKILRILMFPVVYPIATALDRVLGDELPTIWNKKEIIEIIKIHEDSHSSKIDADEERIIIGALLFSDLKAKDVMTPKKNVRIVEVSTKMQDSMIRDLKKSGFTRFPVYGRFEDNMLGVLLIKDLVGLKNLANKTVRSVVRKDKLLIVNEMERLDNLLNKLIRKKIHLAIIMNDHDTFLGVVTLEDLIEAILQRKIADETDAS